MEKGNAEATLKEGSGLRHLYLRISSGEIEGFFLPADGTGNGAERFVSVLDSAPGETLRSIENVVYDHPEIFEDTPAEIIIDTPGVFFYPDRLSNDAVSEVMKKLYDIDENDFYKREEIAGVRSAFTLCHRLKGFTDRTFPGIEIYNQFSPLIGKYSVTGTGKRMYAELSEGKVDIMAFQGRNLLNASSHVCRTAEDIAYYICMVWKRYGFDSQENELFLGGDKTLREKIVPILRRFINYVRFTPRPTLPFDFSLPASVTALYRQHS